PGDVAHHRRDHRRHGGVTDLAEQAASVVDRAASGEQLEVYVARGHETEVRAYDGEVEALSSATSSGVGIRVVLDADAPEGARLGFAWAGSLDPELVEATLAEARDNARFATPDPDVVLASPDAHWAAELELWDDRLVHTPTDHKVEMALSLERQVRKADSRIRQVSSA